MIDAIFIGAVIYLLAGIEVARMVDRAQMKQPVPYGEFRSIFTLEQIRATVFFFMLIAGPFYFVKTGAGLIYRKLKHSSAP